MAGLGFSITELIQALVQAKHVYDAFFDKYKNSASQVRELAEDIDQFRRNLEEHREIVEGRATYSGFESVQRTLDECYHFLDTYKTVLDKQRRQSVVNVFKTAQYALDQNEVARLRSRISKHESNILHFSVNLFLKENNPLLGKESPTIPIPIPAPVPAPGDALSSVSPPSTPPFLGSPLLMPQDAFLASPSRPGSWRNSPTNGELSSMPPPLMTPALPTRQFTRSSQSSVDSGQSYLSAQRTPSPSALRTPRTSVTLPGLILPQSPLPYRVAEVYFGTKKVDLKRKPTGRDFEGGRELVIIDQDGNPRLSHKSKPFHPPSMSVTPVSKITVKYSRTETNRCIYPYTWHSRWENDHLPFQVDFIGTTPDCHSVSFKGVAPLTAVPTYIFTREKDFLDFQSEVRGKNLEGTFEIRQICSALSRSKDATDQHLKLWRDHVTQDFSLSYYASASPKSRHVEFPISMFEPQMKEKGKDKRDIEVTLHFQGTVEPKRSSTFAKAFSRSPTERTERTGTSVSTVSTAVPGVFSRAQTGIASSASSIMTAGSQMSVSSSTLDTSMSQTTGFLPSSSSKLETLESRAKAMRYLKIEFSDEDEATRFRKTWDKLYLEELSRPIDFVTEWQADANQGSGLGMGGEGDQRGGGSVVSSTASPTAPFAMSPELRPMIGPSNHQT
ncbi:hypothetical protein B7494_g6409 [Chlorociboria aeruginascens]|nr:hypothetical protein B7494_g6409 [Chlorociboria aeruginascens]